ncbi:MAG TPA: hypothetical protein GXX19_11145 [Syntrophomonadaceae bacterium]|nr:hypothetical protein [Syntrophomonadaceae bacterium]
MPPLREHLKAARKLLGHSDPLVHRLLDRAVERLGPRHRFVSHNQEYIKFIGQMLGREAALEATLHLLQDWGLVEPSDYRFDAPSSTGRLPRQAARPLSK